MFTKEGAQTEDRREDFSCDHTRHGDGYAETDSMPDAVQVEQIDA